MSLNVLGKTATKETNKISNSNTVATNKVPILSILAPLENKLIIMFRSNNIFVLLPYDMQVCCYLITIIQL